MKFVFRIRGDINFKILLDNSGTGGSGSIAVNTEYLFAFQFWYLNFVWKTDEGEAESIVLLICVLWWCFYCWWVAVLWLCRKLKAHLFPAGILAESIAWHILACCNGWIFLHFFLWAITVSDFRTLEICKNLGLPSYLLSLLQSTGTQITVSINIFISFKYTVWN